VFFDYDDRGIRMLGSTYKANYRGGKATPFAVCVDLICILPLVAIDGVFRAKPFLRPCRFSSNCGRSNRFCGGRRFPLLTTTVPAPESSRRDDDAGSTSRHAYGKDDEERNLSSTKYCLE
jgi:hypothetical protein